MLKRDVIIITFETVYNFVFHNFFFLLPLARIIFSCSLYFTLYYEDNNKYRMKSVYLNKIECKINNLMYMFLKSGCVE